MMTYDEFWWNATQRDKKGLCLFCENVKFQEKKPGVHSIWVICEYHYKLWKSDFQPSIGKWGYDLYKKEVIKGSINIWAKE